MKKEDYKKVKKKKHILLKLIILIILIAISLFSYSRKIEVKNIKVKEYKIENSLIPWSFDGFKIIQFADLNYGSTIFKEELKEIVNLINEQSPDLVLFTGNLISEDYTITEEEADYIVSNLKEIQSITGKYAIKGVFDNKIEDINIMLSNGGFKVLDNEYELIYYKGLTPIYLTGLSSYLTTRIDYEKAFSYYKENKKEENIYMPEYKIVMVSESDASNEIIKNREDVNLILTSNSLGGIVRLGKYSLFKQEGSTTYYDDYYKTGNTEIYVNTGLGTNSLKLRFNNSPSINLYRLNTIN